MASALEGALPPGWRLVSGAVMVAVDGAAFPNRKHLKGEADLLLVDPDGVVQVGRGLTRHVCGTRVAYGRVSTLPTFFSVKLKILLV